MINLRPYQEDLKARIFDAWKSGYKNVLLVSGTGSGKCFAANTPVLMYDGIVKLVQDILEGDKLMGPDSKPRVVTSLTRGSEEMFKVTPVKGDCHTFNRSHILTLRASYSRGVYEQGDLLDISIDDYLATNEKFKHQFKWARVGVNFPKRKTEFNPYLLGIYLAEGATHTNHITTPNNEIISFLRKWVNENDMRLSIREGSNCFEIGFAENKQGWNKNKIKKLRKSCLVKGSRWIPKEYLVNDEETRLQVLAGLLDGDGYLHRGGFELVTKYKQLSEDVLFLCRSLGLAAYCKKVTKTIKSINFSGEYYRISISGHTDKIPNKLDYKKAPPREQIKNVLNTGFKIESIGESEYYGFTLGESDGRFLLGDFTITHNTICFCSIVIDTLRDQRVSLPTAIMVHRKELVQQICLTLAEEGIQHNIIASRPTIKGIIAAERRVHGKQFYNAQSTVTVISVDTLNARYETYKNWCNQIKQWITDEAAHVLKENKWGRAISYFKNARGLGVTATPERLDRKGLGSHVDGVFDIMIEAPPTRWFIDNGYLSKYKIAIPDSDYLKYLESKSSTSDYSKKAMIEASNESQIVGDVVENYLKFAKGKQVILFASDVATAKKMEKQFTDKGIIAKSLDGTTPDAQRLDALIKFREKKIQVLINVDLFDEGLDVPGIECVIMARPTKSLGKFLQMIGRGLRVAEGKDFLILIDHVGNVMEHGLPCKIRTWTLDRIKKTGKKLNFLRICSNFECNSPFDRVLTSCPWCGQEAVSAAKCGEGGGRVPPKMVDGDLTLIDPETIRELEELAELEAPGRVAERVSHAVNGAAGLSSMKKQRERIDKQKELAEEVALWAGRMKNHYGYTDRMIHKKFYIHHGMTITEVLGQPKADMELTLEQLKYGSY